MHPPRPQRRSGRSVNLSLEEQSTHVPGDGQLALGSVTGLWEPRARVWGSGRPQPRCLSSAGSPRAVALTSGPRGGTWLLNPEPPECRPAGAVRVSSPPSAGPGTYCESHGRRRPGLFVNSWLSSCFSGKREPAAWLGGRVSQRPLGTAGWFLNTDRVGTEEYQWAHTHTRGHACTRRRHAMRLSGDSAHLVWTVDTHGLCPHFQEECGF